MTARRLKTGSATRPLTPHELETLAMFMAFVSDSCAIAERHILEAGGDPASDDAVDIASAAADALEDDDTNSEQAWVEARGVWACMSEWRRELWRMAARTQQLHIFQMLGDQFIDLQREVPE